MLGEKVECLELLAHGNGALLCVLLGTGDPVLGEGETGEFMVEGRVVGGREVLELVEVGLRRWWGIHLVSLLRLGVFMRGIGGGRGG